MSKILNDANDGGVTRTKIMCRASLSYFQLKRYLIVLTQNELISYDSNTRKF
ncbi:MAG TPA: winged helix-turn-helix domain-containing protein [Nitrososphaeraceae archaeon]|nr:winged helix-turn-helix domain-containing protein [Nitrososphaeraceae archaeon]